MQQDKPAEEFQVVDRRRFSETGERREDVPDEAATVKAEPSKPAPPAPPKPQAAPPKQQAAKPAPKPSAAQSPAAQQVADSYQASGIGMRKVGFDRVVMTYAQTAMLQLGLLAADPSQPLEPDLYGARETIDALALIEEKTRGNLTAQEQQMIENALFELRMAWMEIDRRYAAKTKPK